MSAMSDDLNNPQDRRPAGGADPSVTTAGEESIKHRGLHFNRTHDNCWSGRMEKTFAEEWEKEQYPPGFLNGGMGCLTLLITSRLEKREWCAGEDWVSHPEELTQRDAQVAATVVQWLGTNVGFCWLTETLAKCGYSLDRSTEDPTEAPNSPLEHAPPLTGCSDPEKETPHSTVTIADLGIECIKLDAKVDQLQERIAAELQSLDRKYRNLYDSLMELRSRVYRMENQR